MSTAPVRVPSKENSNIRSAVTGRGTLCFAISFIIVAMLSGCGSQDASKLGNDLLHFDLDKSNAAYLVRYYIGSYMGPGGGDPFAAGIAVKDGADLYLHADSLGNALRDGLDPNGDGKIEWDELSDFVASTYYDARGIETDLASLKDRVKFERENSDWFRVDIDGVMTRARRQIFVPTAAMREALLSFRKHGNTLIYPTGTVIFGEHVQDASIKETTVMQKREDGLWDFFIYGENGDLVSETSTGPKSLAAPVQCVGCHTGGKLFSPEKNYPAPSPPGPDGPRQILDGPRSGDGRWVRVFDEHRKRSDTVLGIYNTLYMERLCAMTKSNDNNHNDAQVLATFDNCSNVAPQ